MTALEHSPSATVRRHASAFVRTWPEPPAPIAPSTPTRTARRIGIDDLGAKSSPRRKLAALADELGWTWRADHAVAPDGSGAWSVVVRARKTTGWPWETAYVVGHWRARSPVAPLRFVAGWSWRVEAGQTHDLSPVGGRELLGVLRDPPRPTPRTVPKVARSG